MKRHTEIITGEPTAPRDGYIVLWTEAEMAALKATMIDDGPEGGGFIVPPKLARHKAGRKAAMWRLLGRMIRSPVVYRRGMKQIFPPKAGDK